MRYFKVTAVAAMLLLCAVSASAATAAEFYVDILQKGIAQYNAAAYAEAATLLRTAAFGLLEATDRYQTAQVYRTIVADKLADPTTARDAARRVLSAERVQRTYASLALPAGVRTSFETVAKKVLPPGEISALTTAAPATPSQTQTQPQPQTPPPSITPAPQPEKKPPVVQDTKPKSTTPTTTTTTPAKPQQQAKPVETKPAPKPAAVPPPRTTTVDVVQQLASADKALTGGDLNEARRLYRVALDAPLTHEQAMRIAEGLYRARDFTNVLRAFDKAGALRKGEEPYRFYLAVAFFETGNIAAAKKELAAALNFIEVTPDVARYRERIENATD